jgi:hypothetical protein
VPGAPAPEFDEPVDDPGFGDDRFEFGDEPTEEDPFNDF